MTMIVMTPTATAEDITVLIGRGNHGRSAGSRVAGDEITVIGAIGHRERIARLGLEGFPGSPAWCRPQSLTRLASSEFRHGDRSLGALMRPSSGRRSIRSIASQQAA